MAEGVIIGLGDGRAGRRRVLAEEHIREQRLRKEEGTGERERGSWPADFHNSPTVRILSLVSDENSSWSIRFLPSIWNLQ